MDMRILGVGNKAQYVSDTLTSLIPTQTTGPARNSINAPSDNDKQRVNGDGITIGQEQLMLAIERSIKALEGANTALQVSVHEQTKSIMVKVLNRDTGEVIREIPSEKILDLTAKMMEFAGILIDRKV